MSNSQIFLPLRSNGAFFESPESQTLLERKVKMSLVLYDDVIFEDGRYEITAGTDGQGMQMRFPGDSFPGDRTVTHYGETGSAFGAEIDGLPAMQSTCDSHYSIDYVPILHKAQISDAEYINFVECSLNPEAKQRITQMTRELLQNNDVAAALPKNPYLRNFVLESFIGDSLIAYNAAVPMGIDSCSASLSTTLSSHFVLEPSVPESAFNWWTNFGLVDFSQLSWDEVVEIRESFAGASFRKLIAKVACESASVARQVGSQDEMDAWVKSVLDKELILALKELLKRPKEVLVTVGLNLIPYGGIIDVLLQSEQLVRQQASWVSLINR